MIRRLRDYAIPILMGLAILAVGLIPWTQLAWLNARYLPEIPWAALVTLAYVALMLLWLDGSGPPSRHRAKRRELLRLWPPTAPDTSAPTAGVLVGTLLMLYGVWTIVSLQAPLPDLGESPTTAHRWSLMLMGGVTAGVVEEAAFRGYLQTGIERFDRRNAIWITSLVFVAAHATQGVQAMLLLGPGLFLASMLYGMLARRTGSILPGMVLHVLGDLSRVYFGVLRGDAGLLSV